MSLKRVLIFSFWIFIGSMLLWQFYDYDRGLKEAAKNHPPQEHFWFTNSVAAAPAQPVHDGAYVQQTAFSIENNVPSTGSFTCHVTLKNVGNAKAMAVQALVRPYRGIIVGDEDVGHSTVSQLSDSDPLSQFGQWVTFPNLAPGESNTQNLVFLSRSDATPGMDPDPEIIYTTAKAKPQPPASPAIP